MLHKSRRRRVAVIGAGISGVAAASVLHDSGVVDVVLYEQQSRVGGHADTRKVRVPVAPEGTTAHQHQQMRDVEVDCGFMVMNRITYPNLIEFFNSKGVETEPSDMSFAVSVGDEKEGLFEWGSDSLSTLFAQRTNILNPYMYGFISDVLRFESQVNEFLSDFEGMHTKHTECIATVPPHPLIPLTTPTTLKMQHPLVIPSSASAKRDEIVEDTTTTPLLSEEPLREILPKSLAAFEAKTLGSFLKENNYGSYFVDYYVLPMCQAIWSCPRGDVLDFPALFLFRFMKNHHLLSLVSRPQWQTIAGRTQRGYVEKVTRGFKHNIRVNTKVKHVFNSEEGKVLVEDDKGNIEQFDSAILASHAPDTLNILGEHATLEERGILGAFEYQDNDIWLHHDKKLMPRNQSIWASWNFLGNSKGGVCCTYWLNRLQNLGDTGKPILLTLNPVTPPSPELVVANWKMAHPVPSLASEKAMKSFNAIQGVRGLYYCGAYTGYGFHEDGFKSGQMAANLLLGNIDWQPLALKRFFTPSWKESLEKRIVVSYLNEFIQKGRLLLCEDGGEVIVFGQKQFELEPDMPTPAMLNIHSPVFYSQLAERADLGLAEAFMDGIVSSPNLLAVFEVIIFNRDLMRHRNNNSIKMISTSFINNALAYLRHLGRANNINNTRKNIHAHYDLGNKLFALFLDETMTYSCGIFKTPRDSLYDSQINKLNAMIEKARITPECNVLEIGFGWGSLSIAIAERYGCHVTGITLSEEQKAYAEDLVKKKGLGHLITYHLVDYRLFDAEGNNKFDRILSCEMLEAVGHEFLPEFFSHCNRLLKKDGVLVVQVITMPDDRYDEYRKSSDFIKEYIFPGGCTPSLSAIVEACKKCGSGCGKKGKCSGASHFVVDQLDNIGPHYATTLRMWKDNFMAKKAELLAMGFDETFIRKWEYYFIYCEAGFRTCTLAVLQLVFTRPGNAKVFGCKL